MPPRPSAAEARAGESGRAPRRRPIEAEPARRRREAPAPVEHYDDLAAEEVIALLGSLEADDLAALREHEREHARRDGVLAAIDSVLARAGGPVGAGASGAAQGSRSAARPVDSCVRHRRRPSRMRQRSFIFVAVFSWPSSRARSPRVAYDSSRDDLIAGA